MNQLDQRLRQRESDSDERIQDRLDIAKKEIEQSKLDGFHDTTIVNDDLEVAYKDLEDFIFGNADNDEPSESNPIDRTQGPLVVGNSDVEMASGDGDASGSLATSNKEASAPLLTESVLDRENQERFPGEDHPTARTSQKEV